MIILLFISCVLGSISYYESSESVSISNTTTMQNKVTMMLNVTEAFDYLREWNAEIHSHDGNHNIRICLTQEGPLILNEHVWNPGPSWGVAFGFIVLKLEVGEHTLDIKYGTGSDGLNVAIRRARIMASEINL